MAKNKINTFWIDAFNLFHRWNKTSALFATVHTDPQRIHNIAFQTLSNAIGKARSRTTLFMDGGVNYHSCTVSGLKIRYPGPGKKADNLLEEAARARQNNRNTAVITSDNFLAATMRRNGTKIISCDEFIRKYLINPAEKTQSPPKPPTPNADEVQEWLEYFGEE